MRQFFLTKILTCMAIFIYIMIAILYPVAHFHVHHTETGIHIEISFHPPVPYLFSVYDNTPNHHECEYLRSGHIQEVECNQPNSFVRLAQIQLTYAFYLSHNKLILPFYIPSVDFFDIKNHCIPPPLKWCKKPISRGPPLT